MSYNKRPFTCYFCNKLIDNETEMGHTTLCSKVLIPCPYKCGSYVERANLPEHKATCNNNIRKSVNFDQNSLPRNTNKSANSLDRNGTSNPKLQSEISNLQQKFTELEGRLSLYSQNNRNTTGNATNNAFEDIKSTLKQHSLSIQKANYFNGFISEWKKNIDSQITKLKDSLMSIDTVKKESAKQWVYIQERLLQFENLKIDLNLLKETVYKENSRSKNTEMDFARNLEEIRGTFNEQIMSFENMWHEQSEVIQNITKDILGTKQALDEQKAKYAGLIFDLRAISQIASEAAEKIEIIERDFNVTRQEMNQMKINVDILEDLSSRDNTTYHRLIWRITEIESKLKRTKESDVVLKSPIFYTHQYGYKIRVLLYLNGFNKWKDRYALACLHVMKGEYDPLLLWPCIIEGHITLRDLTDTLQKRDFSKYIRTKRACGDENEDEPQESSPTYIFIPHSVLFKSNYTKNDTFFLDIVINETKNKHETSL